MCVCVLKRKRLPGPGRRTLINIGARVARQKAAECRRKFLRAHFYCAARQPSRHRESAKRATHSLTLDAVWSVCLSSPKLIIRALTKSSLSHSLTRRMQNKYAAVLAISRVRERDCTLFVFAPRGLLSSITRRV